MAALGMETSSGDFEVIDLCFAGMPELAKPEAGPSNTNGSAKGKEKAKNGSDVTRGSPKHMTDVSHGQRKRRPGLPSLLACRSGRRKLQRT
jgi:hypothetical protein